MKAIFGAAWAVAVVMSRDIHSCQPNCYAYSHSNSAECHTFTHTYSNPDNRRVRYGIDTAGRVFSRE